jgi:PIN domain nuclease of toxin-antitoxin system
MGYLLDTHTIIWYVENNPNLPQRIRNIIENQPKPVIFSLASIWEMSIKTGLGKLSLSLTLNQIVDKLVNEGLIFLPIKLDHTVVVQTLPHHHRDPFDRMLIAQSDVEKCTILTRDPAFDDYNVSVLW